MGQVEKAIQLLDEMEHSGTKSDSITFIILITACANNNLIEQGKYLHNLALKLDNISIELWNSILNFYTKCNQPEKTIEIMEEIDQKLRNTISWNCLIQAYIKMNEIDKSIQLLDEMEKNGVISDSTTFIILITACANNNLIEQGRFLHNLALKLGNMPIDLWNSILNMYIKCNQPEIAIEECTKLQAKGIMDVITWNCLIDAHLQSQDINSAFDSFQQMKLQNIEPDIFTFTILLSGCGDFLSQEKGLSIIQEIRNRGLDMSEEIISSMINFYSKIGEKSKVEELIKLLQERYPILSIISYNTILSHYANHGNGIEAKSLFDEMVKKNVEPNEKTFTIILNSFSQCGTIGEAVNLFNDLELKYNHKPSTFEIGAMIDVYSRAGLFEKAVSLIGDEMNYIWWNSILGGSRKFNNIQMGELAFSKLQSIQSQDPSPFILMSQIYAYHGLNEKAEMIRNLMEMNGIKKIPAIVYHEENGHTFKFISGSTDIERYDEVEKMRNEIYRKIIQAGFKANTKLVSNSTKLLTEEEKLEVLSKHAEKTAIAHALVLNPKRNKILLNTSNLRMCNDCHNAVEFISKVFNIEIIVRDASRYHHFVNGKCTCNNYW